MSPTINDKDIDDIIAKYEGLVTRRDALSENVVKVQTVLAERRKALKKVMDESREKGYDPDRIQEELQHAKEVVMVKIDNFAAELEEGENMIRPMLKELREAG